jgi:NADH-quinone oxidoreductase subunit H
MKLPVAQWLQYVLVFVGNIVVIAVVINILSGYFKREQIRTKRAFSPKSLIGTMRPATETGD